MAATTLAPDEVIAGAHCRYIVRIELTASRRRQLGDMARAAGISADALAALLLSDVIDGDAAAHQRHPTAKNPKPGERA